MVVLVVIVFLQTWRASIIPLLAVPVSIVGTFGVMHLFGFSINALSLFGLVLAIGIVVDDAIVVVENVERGIEDGLSPPDATIRAMTEVTSPIIRDHARALRGLHPDRVHQRPDRRVLPPVCADHRVLHCDLGVQFAHAQSRARRDFCCSRAGRRRMPLTRTLDFLFGWFFRAFNAVFRRGSKTYGGGVGRLVNFKAGTLVVYLLLLASTYFVFRAVPPGFVPVQGQAVSRQFRAASVWRHARPHRGGHPPDVGYRAEGAGRAERGGVPRPLDQRLYQQRERGHRLRHA